LKSPSGACRQKAQSTLRVARLAQQPHRKASPAKPTAAVATPQTLLARSFGADLAPDHPGYHDEAYKRRRVEIAELARAHRM
jgi:hypothetical protein